MSEGAKRAAAEARRQIIVDAAAACARRSGFHGASMAEIAQAAGLSVGQIYRYFENKEAIISAIVARDIAEMQAWMTEAQTRDGGPTDAIVAKCSTAVEEHYDRERAALDLEVVAEAARNTTVAGIVEAADIEKRALGEALLRRTLPEGCSDCERRARGEILNMLFEGMTIRGVSNPKGDREAITRVLEAVVRRLLEGPL
ncbi:TetR/AcrR family transcriptional regulator [Phenylobacterium sp.]|uniref:TetR/AcrR family transcriptional regulator n=1 Tax=Phenylobacterium sp. TaxID=1871053 RepID=UPI00301B7268